MSASPHARRETRPVMFLDGPMAGQTHELPFCTGFTAATADAPGVFSHVTYRMSQFMEMIDDDTARSAWFASIAEDPVADETMMIPHLRRHGQIVSRVTDDYRYSER